MKEPEENEDWFYEELSYHMTDEEFGELFDGDSWEM